MHYYDDEVRVGRSEVNPLSTMKVKRISRADSNNVDKNMGSNIISINEAISKYQNKTECIADDDGLVESIINKDSRNSSDNYHNRENCELKSNSPILQPHKKNFSKQHNLRHEATASLVNKRSDISGRCTEDENIKSDSESENDIPLFQTGIGTGTGTGPSSNENINILNITSEKWEHLPVGQDIKNVFAYILKYTPQHIETTYHMQSFIPDYVPAVGDVDAFLKVSTPPAKVDASEKCKMHLRKIGLEFLDEPSGNQTEPTLLNIKLRSILTGNFAKSRATAATLVPIARNVKDIDKWLTEVDQIHKTQSIFDIPLRKDIERMLIEWPRTFSVTVTNNAYQQCLSGHLTLNDYIRTLCEHLNIQGQLETKTDYLLSVHTLFALYLAASQAWD